MKIAVREPAEAGEFELYYDLRWRILREPWTHERESGKDAFEEQAYHLAAWDGSRLVGAGRLHFISAEECQVRYMAVEEDCRGRGVGRAILEALEKRARERGAKTIVLNARENAIGFYRKRGYELINQSSTLFESLLHWRMQKPL